MPITILCLLLALGAGPRRDDGRIDLADFGRPVEYTGESPETLETRPLERGFDGWDTWRGPDGQFMMGLEFDEPRDIAEAGIEFRHAIAERTRIQVQYWRQHWPVNTTGKTGGWAPVDDPFHGEWVTARAEMWAGDRSVYFAFRPFNEEEQGKDLPNLTYRRTYRLRFLLGRRELPPMRYLHAYGPGAPIEREFEAHLGGKTRIGLPLDISVVNGHLLDDFRLFPAVSLQVESEPITFRVRFAAGDIDSPSRTIVTLRDSRNKEAGVSFLPAEAERYGGIEVPAMGVTILPPRRTAPPPDTQAAPTIFDRVAAEPEQTFERARRELPELDPRPSLYVPLGPPHARQEIAIRYGGSVEIHGSALKVAADDGKPGKGRTVLRLRTGVPPADPGADRRIRVSRLDGYLPIVKQSWEHAGVSYEQTSVATYLSGEPGVPRGDEPVVLLCRLKVANRTQASQPGAVRLTWPVLQNPPESLIVQNGDVLLAGGSRDSSADPIFHVKGDFQTEEGGEGKASDTLVWKSDLAAGQVEVLEWYVPFSPATERAESELAGLDFDRVVTAEAERWRRLVAKSATYDVPDPLLSTFWKSSLVNLWISADRDPFNGMEVLPAGTFGYNVCLNESCIQVRSLELRGLHGDAERYLDAMVRGQSSKPLQGRFTDQEGVFLGMPTRTGDYQTFNYNLDHGFLLWTLAEHFRFTRDRDWLTRTAPAMIKACDFVTRQAKWKPGTNTLSLDDRNWGIGLLPPGHLEDPPEWLWWFAVNAYAWRGMDAAARVLGEIDHPEARRLSDEAAAFGDTLRRSCKESMIRAPVVRLRDGTYVPFQPTRSRLRGRDTGWIRDALYGPIHLIECGVYAPNSPEAEWILRDAEDNVFSGGQRGYEMSDPPTQWFSWGGMTLQPNLLPAPTVYQDRGLRKHALRGFYNTLCASIYADAGCFAEWVPRPGKGGGPLFKPPDESAFVVFMRDLLVRERGDELDLLAGAPAEWLKPGRRIRLQGLPTWFGSMDLLVRSDANAREVAIELTGPQRNPPRRIRIHTGALGRIIGAQSDGKPLAGVDTDRGIIELPAGPPSIALVIQY